MAVQGSPSSLRVTNEVDPTSGEATATRSTMNTSDARRGWLIGPFLAAAMFTPDGKGTARLSMNQGRSGTGAVRARRGVRKLVRSRHAGAGILSKLAPRVG